MAEFLGQRLHDEPDTNENGGFNAMGKPIPAYRRQAAYEHCKEMGLSDKAQITRVVDGVAQALGRDKPYEAMAEGMRYLDLTGTYRLFAVLLTAEKPRKRVKAVKSLTRAVQ